MNAHAKIAWNKFKLLSLSLESGRQAGRRASNLTDRVHHLHPGTIMVLSFLVAVMIGACLLSLPQATQGGRISPIDAVFTATSAVCVTGLVVVDTGSYFTLFGQMVILVLIQVGGLGVMTLSVLAFRALGRGISLKQRIILRDAFAHTPCADIWSLVKSIFVLTAAVELAGAAILTVGFQTDMPLPRAMYYGLFHSISAFCNAGFGLFSDSLVRYSGSPLFNVTVSLLIVSGGLGFSVLHDLGGYFRKNTHHRWKTLGPDQGGS